MMLKLLQSLLFPLVVTISATSTAKSCRCRPSDPCWPSHAEWTSLNKTVNGNLIALRPVGAVCHGSEFNAEACHEAKLNGSSSVWRSDQPGMSIGRSRPLFCPPNIIYGSEHWIDSCRC